MNIGGLGNMNETNATKVLGYVDAPLWTNIDATFTSVSILLTGFTLFFAFRNWYNNKKQLESIKIYLRIKLVNKKILLEEYLSRKDARRSELQGILANQLIKGVTRYNIDYLGNKLYFDNINELQKSKTNVLIIEIENDEIGQFADFIVARLGNDYIVEIKKYIDEFLLQDEGKPTKKLKQETIRKLNL